MTTYYMGIGVCLAFLSGCFLIAWTVYIILGRYGKKKLRYHGRMPKKAYSEDFLEAMKLAYSAAGDIRGMLLILQDKWIKGTASIRIPAALDYLEHSRYKDYETTLFYLSDQTEACNRVLQEILDQEIRKQRGIACKN